MARAVPILGLVCCLWELSAAAVPGFLKIEALSAGGSSLDEVSLLHSQGDYQYIVGLFNGDDEAALARIPGRFNTDRGGRVEGFRESSGIKIESSAGVTQQEAPIDAVFVAKTKNKLQSIEWLHGPFNCDLNVHDPVLNCTQYLHHAEKMMSPVTGVTVINDELIMSGCWHSAFDQPKSGCANIVKPGQWNLMINATRCANTQGGMVVHGNSIFVAGVFSGELNFDLLDVEGNVLKTTSGLPGRFSAPYILEISPSGDVLGVNSNQKPRPHLIPMFMAAAPLSREGNNRIVILSDVKTRLRSECPLIRTTENIPALGTVLTDASFTGQPNLLFHLQSRDGIFEATGIAIDPMGDGNAAYISGYLRGSLRLPKSCFVNTTETGGRFVHSDGILMKVDLAERAVEWALKVGGPGQDKALAVAAQNGAVYLGGTFEKGLNVEGLIYRTTEDGKCNHIEMTMNMDKIQSENGLDIFILKLMSADLDIQWVTTATSPKDAILTTITLDGSGGIHVGGRFEDRLVFASHRELYSQGMFDAFVASIQENGPTTSESAVVNLAAVNEEDNGSQAWRIGGVIVLTLVSVTVLGITILYTWRWHQSKTVEQKVLESEVSSESLGSHVLQVVPSESHASGCSEE